MITFKIARKGSAERNSEENIEDLYNYALWTMSLDVISSRKNFVDELGVKIHMRRTKGQSAKGERAYRKVSAQKGPNVIICCVVSTAVLLHYQVIQGGMKTEILKIFSKFYVETLSLTKGTMLMDFVYLTMLPGTEESNIWTLVEYSL